MTCPDPTAFIDGEMLPAQAIAFREHLLGCQSCRERVLYGLQLSAQLSMLRDGANLQWLHDDVLERLAVLDDQPAHDVRRRRYMECLETLDRMIGGKS